MDPPQPPVAHRPPLSCPVHPSCEFTGFCPSCLRERLQLLEASTSTATTHRNSTSTISSSLKSIFHHSKPLNPSSANSIAATSSSDLRRCKSFSFSGAATSAVASSFEPQRRSCDVRGKNTLWSLFNQDQRPIAASVAEIVQITGSGDEITAVDDHQNDDDSKQLPMKDHVDLESAKKTKESSSGFWTAASIFSKKLQKWRRKQKIKKMKKNEEIKADQKPSGRFHETQSEIAVDAFGRRSVDIAPRYSLDAGRFSFDDPRYSFDEPRASWDGCLIGARAMHLRHPMVAVVEDDPVAVVERSDGQIPVEEDITIPGGTQQTKDYYSDSSSRSRRRSLDRSSSIRKSSVDLSDMPQFVHSGEVVRDWSSNSLNDRTESFESTYREDLNSKGASVKKSRKWSKAWSIWGLIHRKRDRSNENGEDRSLSEIWPNGYANGRSFRSNSNLSSRSSIYGNAGFGGSNSLRKNGLESKMVMNISKKKKKKDEFSLDRNRSARFSPGHLDNGMLRFYLTPMSGSKRGLGIKRNNSKSSSYHSFTRSVLGLY